MMITGGLGGNRLQIESEAGAKAAGFRKTRKQMGKALRRAQAGRDDEQIRPSGGPACGERS